MRLIKDYAETGKIPGVLPISTLKEISGGEAEDESPKKEPIKKDSQLSTKPDLESIASQIYSPKIIETLEKLSRNNESSTPIKPKFMKTTPLKKDHSSSSTYSLSSSKTLFTSNSVDSEVKLTPKKGIVQSKSNDNYAIPLDEDEKSGLRLSISERINRLNLNDESVTGVQIRKSPENNQRVKSAPLPSNVMTRTSSFENKDKASNETVNLRKPMNEPRNTRVSQILESFTSQKEDLKIETSRESISKSIIDSYQTSPAPPPIVRNPFSQKHSKDSNHLNSDEFLHFAKALYSFDSKNEEDLSFKSGEIIKVIEKGSDNSEENGEWWYGEKEGKKTGYFPSNYVAILAQGIFI